MGKNKNKHRHVQQNQQESSPDGSASVAPMQPVQPQEAGPILKPFLLILLTGPNAKTVAEESIVNFGARDTLANLSAAYVRRILKTLFPAWQRPVGLAGKTYLRVLEAIRRDLPESVVALSEFNPAKISVTEWDGVVARHFEHLEEIFTKFLGNKVGRRLLQTAALCALPEKTGVYLGFDMRLAEAVAFSVVDGVFLKPFAGVVRELRLAGDVCVATEFERMGKEAVQFFQDLPPEEVAKPEEVAGIQQGRFVFQHRQEAPVVIRGFDDQD